MHANKIEPRVAGSNNAATPITSLSRAAGTKGSTSSFLMYLLDISVIVVSLLIDDLIFQNIYGAAPLLSPVFIAELLLVWTGVSLYRGVYTSNGISLQIGHNIRRMVGAVALLMLVTLAIFYLTDAAIERPILLSLFAIMVSLMAVWRLLVRAVTSARGTKALHKTVLIVGATELGSQVAEMIKQSWQNSQIVGFVDNHKRGTWGHYTILGTLDTITALIQAHSVDEVIVSLPHSDYDHINQMVIALKDKAINVSIVPDYLSLALYRPSVSALGSLPLISLTEPALTVSQRVIKRTFDITLASLALMVFAPVMLVIAIAIKLDSKGAILFKQDRIGEGGKIFKMYKFRSMVQNAEALQAQVNVTDENGNTIHKRRNDPRVTRVGRIIRKTSLDELPQLINVLNGTMSIVGPRPELPWIVNEQYQKWQYRRFAVPQGITGWWQVNGRSEKPMHLNTDEDLYYIQNYSFWLDMEIIFKTVPALIRGKGAF